ncbi:HPr family phosphocarrier protein [Methyloferula stellata]|uniref:HPr family phosphocarrier protein n=1 Tax=Methyloferula stellata TaxID=876270 RepID=UPI000375CB81|nr:HPr family phosphocarrier protein [Methyloferula stellata]
MSSDGHSAPDEEDCPAPPAPEGGFLREIKIINKKGLHARATVKFVQCVEMFEAEVTVSRCGETVGGLSIMGILTLGAGIGTSIYVGAKGPQAQDVLDALEKLVANKFDEDE